MRYYIKCKLNPEAKGRLADSIKSGSLARGKVFYEGMQTALREGTIDKNDIVHFVEVCYCLEGGLYPMAMEIPVLNKYFDEVIHARTPHHRNLNHPSLPLHFVLFLKKQQSLLLMQLQ